MKRAAEVGAPGLTGVPVLPPVEQLSEAGRGCVHRESLCSAVQGRPSRSKSASTPPAPVRQACSRREGVLSCNTSLWMHQWMESGCRGRTGPTAPAVVESR